RGGAHPPRPVRSACGDAAWGHRVAPAEIFERGPDLQGRGVLFQVLAPPGPRDGNDVLAAREHPGERKLGRSRLLLARELLDALHQLEVAVEVPSLEAGAVPAPVVCGNVLGLAELAGEEAAAERAVRHEADPELADRGQDL